MKLFRSFSSWMERHVSDGYVKKSKQEGFRSRSAYKLIELNNKLKFLKPSLKYLDLGSSPGGWCQVLSRQVQSPSIIAVDILPMAPIPNVSFLQLDMTLPSTIPEILTHTKGPIDVILSDMSPNHSGIPDLDCSGIIELHLQAIVLAKAILKPSGVIILKMLDGGEEPDHFVISTQKSLKPLFETLTRVKPKSSRQESKEIFYCGLGWKGNKI